MNLFAPPPSKYSGHFEKGKFNFTWRIYILLGFVFGGLTILHATQGDVSMYVAGAAFVFTLASLYVQYITKSYVFGAIVGIIAGSFINQFDLYVIVSSQKFVTILWITCITLYAFYLLGTKWGIIFLILNMSGAIIALLIIPKEVLIQRIEARDEYALIAIILNLVVIVGFITYLMNQMLKTSREAEFASSEARKQLQSQYDIVQSQNEEKTIMLKEIHHRVKNNLQVITSLLRLQSGEITDKKIRAHFEDAIQRVLSMALIHEKMYQSDDLVKIDLKAYIEELAYDLIHSYDIQKPIDLKVESQIQFLQPKSLVSTALLFHELISNSLKHAFTELDHGIINIDIRVTQNQSKVECDYYDNGSWKPPAKEGSFGVQLISDLCEQLDGNFTKETGNGTTYKFVFDYESLD